MVQTLYWEGIFLKVLLNERGKELMEFTKEMLRKLSDYVDRINEENVDGEFFVESFEELQQKVVRHLIEKEISEVFVDETEEDILGNIEIKWCGAGLYRFHGVYDRYEWVNNILEIFDLETGGLNPLMLFGDKEAIQNFISEMVDDDEYLYIAFDHQGVPFDMEFSYEKLDGEDSIIAYKGGQGYYSKEIRDLTYEELFYFGSEYNKLGFEDNIKNWRFLFQ